MVVDLACLVGQVSGSVPYALRCRGGKGEGWSRGTGKEGAHQLKGRTREHVTNQGAYKLKGRTRQHVTNQGAYKLKGRTREADHSIGPTACNCCMCVWRRTVSQVIVSVAARDKEKYAEEIDRAGGACVQ